MGTDDPRPPHPSVGQAAEPSEHALRLIGKSSGRFQVLRAFDGPPTDLGARARQLIRSTIGEDDAGR
jgi:hypothetical protein